jgi:hypothetical protein
VVQSFGAAVEQIVLPVALAASLGEPLHELADLHNYTAWRDALHPHLTHLLEELW